MSTFRFSDYKLRPALESDRALCAAWIEADPAHREVMTPDFFLKPEAQQETFVLEDKWGGPVMFFKMQRALRIHMQFGPSIHAQDRERNREALMDLGAWLVVKAQHSGFRQLIFDSVYAPLIRLVQKRFGFRKSPNELVCNLPPIASQAPQQKPSPVEQPATESVRA